MGPLGPSPYPNLALPQSQLLHHTTIHSPVTSRAESHCGAGQDLRGYLHLRGALSADELHAARDAADALMASHDATDAEAPEIFRTGLHQKVLAPEQRKGPHQVYGFCWDRSLEKIAFHPTTWSVSRLP
eukprot:COSAG06_NODE_4210_length_4470_cov_2.071102_4_plen_129_part_00